MQKSSTRFSARLLLCVGLMGLLPACMPKAQAPDSQFLSRPYISVEPYLYAYHAKARSHAAQKPAQLLYAQASPQTYKRPPALRGFTQPVPEKFYTDHQYTQPQQQSRPAAPVFRHHLDERSAANVQSAPRLAAPAAATLAPRGQPAPQNIQKTAPQYRVKPQSLAPKPSLPAYHPRQNPTPPTTKAPQTINPSEQSLRQSLGSAVQHSPRLAIEDLKIREAQEGLIQSQAQGKFKLDLNGTIGPTQSETEFSVINNSDSDFRINRGANLNLSLPIYQGGRIKAENNVAAIGIEEAKANFDIVETAVAEEAAIAHFNVIRDRQLIKIFERNVQLLQSQKNTVSALLAAGENTVTDQALIDSRLALIEVNLEDARASLAASESTYKKLIGRPAPALLPAKTIPLPKSLREIKATAEKNNPRLKAAQTRIAASQQNIDVAKSFNRPKLALEGVARSAQGQSDTIRRNSAVEVLLNLNIPILSGGENKSRVREATLAQTRAMLESRAIYDDINERIEQLWASVESARRSQIPNRAQIKAAQAAYDAISKQRDAGVATSLDVQTVEQTLLDAQINLIRAENTENVSRFQLLSLMGAL